MKRKLARICLSRMSHPSVAGACFILLLGCDGTSNSDPLAALPSGDSTSSSPVAHIIPWDVGIVQPSSRISREFTIQNDTASVWTVDRVQSSCACTVIGAKFDRIPPGESRAVTVKYTAPAENSDDRRSVFISFKEKSAPVVSIDLAVAVRSPVTILPPVIHARQMASPSTVAPSHCQFNIYNYSDKPWEDVAASADVPWTKVQLREVPPGAAAIQGFQIASTVVPAHCGTRCAASSSGHESLFGDPLQFKF